jgi:type III pantothenate kinase
MKKYSTSLFLADIGHTNAKLWRNGKVETVSLRNFKPENIKQTFYFISVNKSYQSRFEKLKNWINLENFSNSQTTYETLGVDRKIAIHDLENGIIVDMGSAITIDIVKSQKHLGGYILLGKESLMLSFKDKIPHLNFGNSLCDEVLPNKTEDALTCGFYHPLVSLIRELESRYKVEVIFTGGDSTDMKNFFPKAIFNKNLLFHNMIKIVETNF